MKPSQWKYHLIDGAIQTNEAKSSLRPDLEASRQFLFLLGSPLEDVPAGEATPETKHTFLVIPEAQGSTVETVPRRGTLGELAVADRTEQTRCRRIRLHPRNG